MIDFRIENELITEEELNEFEQEIGLTLPEDYRVHMLKYNGGLPQSYSLYFGEPDDGILLSSFKSIKLWYTSGRKTRLFTRKLP